ncbi:MAG: DNA polymerase IV, partial [Mesorhizobium sp.]
SRGQDDRRVDPGGDAKSVSAETTFDADIGTMAELVPVLRALSEKVSARLKKSGIAGRTVVLKLKTQDFKLRTRNRQLGDPTRLADRIFQTGLDLLRREADGTKYRLLGIGVSDLSDDGKADPPDLVDVQSRKRALAEGAIDSLRDKFGKKAVETGYTFGRGRGANPPEPIEE